MTAQSWYSIVKAGIGGRASIAATTSESLVVAAGAGFEPVGRESARPSDSGSDAISRSATPPHMAGRTKSELAFIPLGAACSFGPGWWSAKETAREPADCHSPEPSGRFSFDRPCSYLSNRSISSEIS